MSELFKLPDNYTWLQLRDSYKRLAIQNHPDKGGDPDFFNYITNEFQKLAINIKQREKDHFSLKQNSADYLKQNSVVEQSYDSNDFHNKFNKMFTENKFIDDDVEFGYGKMMAKSSKTREDINIDNIFGKTNVSATKFNQTFDNKVKPGQNIIKYKEPEALPSCSRILHSEIGAKTSDYTGTYNNLQYTDFKRAYTEERVPTDNSRKQFKTVKEYQQYSDKKLKQSMTEKELVVRQKYEKIKDKREQERLDRIAERDQKIEEYYEKVSRLGIRM